MTIALAVWAVLATAAAFVFAVSSRFLGERLREVNAAMHASATQQVRAIADERDRATLMITHERERHVAEVERLNDLNAKALDRVLHMVSYGTPETKPAEVKDPEPDAETRMQQGISDDMVAVGAQRIQKMYEGIGQVVSLEECAEEARSMLYGLTPQIPPERLGLGVFLRDGPPSAELVHEAGTDAAS
jgi:hypothetical protein